MRAKSINEIKNFERGKDPKKAMDIGMTDERILDKAVKDLKEFGLNAKWNQDPTMSKGFYIMDIETGEFFNTYDLQIAYSNEEAAMEEFAENEDDQYGGWIVYDVGGEPLMDESSDFEDALVVILEFIYGKDMNITIKNIQQEIKRKEEYLKYIQKAEKLINKKLTNN